MEGNAGGGELVPAHQQGQEEAQMVHAQSRFIPERVDYPEPHEPVPVVRQHLNVAQVRIETTEDRIRLILARHVSRGNVRQQWFGALAVFLTVIAALTAADGFRDLVGLSGDTWRGFFIIVGLIALGLLVFRGWAAARAPDVDRVVEDVIRELENRPLRTRKSRRSSAGRD